MTRKQNKIKVVIGINDLAIGGAQRHLVKQFRHVNEEQFEYHLITLFHPGKRETFYNDVGEHIKIHRFEFRGVLDIKSWWKLFILLRTVRPQVVMTSLFFSNTVFRVLKPFVGYRVISREHNTYVDKTKPQILVDRLLSHLTYCIVAVSEEVAEFTSSQEHISRQKFTVIENGIDLEEIKKEREKYQKNTVRRELNIPDSALVFTNVARLAAQKNQAALIKAFIRFRQTHQESYLVVLGEGGRRAELEGMIKEANAEAYIQLLGTRQDIHRYYIASDIFVSTSFIEGFSNAHLEALAHGLPILSTKTSGTPRMLDDGKNGFFIISDSESDILKGLEQIVKAPFDDMGKCAKAKVKSFDIMKNVTIYEKLFKKAAGVNITHD